MSTASLPSIDAFLYDCRINAGTALIGLSLFDTADFAEGLPFGACSRQPCGWYGAMSLATMQTVLDLMETLQCP